MVGTEEWESMNKALRRYMETLDKLLTDYAFRGIQAVATIPDYLLNTANTPRPVFNVIFRQAGELHSYLGTYEEHTNLLVQRGNKS